MEESLARELNMLILNSRMLEWSALESRPETLNARVTYAARFPYWLRRLVKNKLYEILAQEACVPRYSAATTAVIAKEKIIETLDQIADIAKAESPDHRLQIDAWQANVRLNPEAHYWAAVANVQAELEAHKKILDEKCVAYTDFTRPRAAVAGAPVVLPAYVPAYEPDDSVPSPALPPPPRSQLPRPGGSRPHRGPVPRSVREETYIDTAFSTTTADESAPIYIDGNQVRIFDYRPLLFSMV
jgi:hypothetical protein